MQKAIFLDRDGVINIDKGYVYRKEDFEFCNGIFDALRHFLGLGYLLVVVTNQSGIGRGYYADEDFIFLTKWMLKELEEKGLKIAKVYHCAHAPEENCKCRKPETAMFEEAIREFGIDVKNSWMIGDKKSDIEAANGVGVENTIFIGSSCKSGAKFKVDNVCEIKEIVAK